MSLHGSSVPEEVQGHQAIAEISVLVVGEGDEANQIHAALAAVPGIQLRRVLEMTKTKGADSQVFVRRVDTLIAIPFDEARLQRMQIVYVVLPSTAAPSIPATGRMAPLAVASFFRLRGAHVIVVGVAGVELRQSLPGIDCELCSLPRALALIAESVKVAQLESFANPQATPDA
jgi:hypothetical protein